MPAKAKQVIAVVLILMGLTMAAFGDSWAPHVFTILADSETGSWLEHFVAFLPLAIIGTGAALFASGHRDRDTG